MTTRSRASGGRGRSATRPARASSGSGATGVVLAGGGSRRFGSDKLSARFRGSYLLDHAVLRLAEFTREVIVVLAPGRSDPTFPPGTPVRTVRDATADQGPLEGVVAGLAASGSGLTVVIGGDMPDVSTAVAMEMLRVAANDRSVDAVALQDGDAFRPLPLVVRTTPALEVARALRHRDERRLRALPQALRTAVIDEPTWQALDPERRTMWDVDEPGDLEGR